MKVSPFQFGRLLKLHLLLTIPSPESRLGSDFTFPPLPWRVGSSGRYRGYQRSLQAPAAPRTHTELPARRTTFPRAPLQNPALNKLLRESGSIASPDRPRDARPGAAQHRARSCPGARRAGSAPPDCGRRFGLLRLCKWQRKQETARAPPLRPRSPSGGRQCGGSGAGENRG